MQNVQVESGKQLELEGKIEMENQTSITPDRKNSKLNGRKTQSPQEGDEEFVSHEEIEVLSIFQSRKKKGENRQPGTPGRNSVVSNTGHGGQSGLYLPRPAPVSRTQSQNRVVVHFPPDPGSLSGNANPASVPSKSSVQRQYLRSLAENESTNQLESIKEQKDSEEEGREKEKKRKKKKKKKVPRVRGGLSMHKINPINNKNELYQLTMGMMIGLRCSVGRENTLDTRDLYLTDFMQVDKYMFPPKGNPGGRNPTPPHSLEETFKFKDYSPKIFEHIRQRFNIDRSNYMLSVAGVEGYLEFKTNSKSGQFFFHSHDGRYMIKTMSSEETKFLRRILPHYFQHITQYPNTLLTRFYGMHRVKMRHLNRKVHFVIMETVFNTVKTIHQLYDLKGSTKGRRATQDEKENGAPSKDLDLLEDQRKLYLGDDCKRKFMSIIRADVKFLEEMKIMDYSLLVGIHERYQGNDDNEVPRRGMDRSRFIEMSSYDLSPLGPLNRPSLKSQPNAIHENDEEEHSETARRPSNTYESVTSQGSSALNKDSFDEGSAPPTLFQVPSLESSGWKKLFGFKSKSSSNLTPISTIPSVVTSDLDREVEGSLSQMSTGTGGTGGINPDFYQQNGRRIKNRKKKQGNQEKRATAYMVSDDKKYPQELEYKSEEEESLASESENSDSDAEIGSDEDNLPSLPVEFSGTTSFGLDSHRDEITPKPMFEAFRAFGPSASRHGNSHMNSAGSHYSVESSVRPLRLSNRRDNGIYSQKKGEGPGREIYYLGIIDILQQYNVRKSMETVLRGVVSDVKTISAVSPEKYGERFIEFMDKNTK